MLADIVPQSLGYVGVRAKDLGDWASYGFGLLGLQRIDKSRSTLAFRMDDRRQRMIVDPDAGEGERLFRLGGGRRGGAGRPCAAPRNRRHGRGDGARARADQRFVRGLIAFTDPQGNRLEIFHSAATPTRRSSPTADLRIPHRPMDSATW